MKERAKSLRKNMPTAEQHMWYFLRDRRLQGYKFVREYVIGTYIVDFICREKQLIIEIDGGQHMDTVVYDQKRTNYLSANRYHVIRFWNNEVFHNLQEVLSAILNALETPHPSLRDTFSPKGEKGE